MSDKVTISAIKADVPMEYTTMPTVTARLAERWSPLEHGAEPAMPEHLPIPAGAPAGHS